MRMADLTELRAPRPYPAVTLILPLQAHLPGNPEDPIRLRGMVDRVRRRLHDELGARASEEILERLDDAVAGIDLRRPSEGVAVFVAPDETHVVALPFPVPERVEINRCFAIRDLVRGLARTSPYRVLALGEQPTRLFEGTGAELSEVRSGGFPLRAEVDRGEPHASRDYPLANARTEEQHRRFFREVDDLYAATCESPIPLVVAGAERDLAYFDEVTRHRESIIGTLAGNYEDSNPRELAARALPIVEAHLAAGRAKVSGELVDAVGVGRAVVGIKAVWDAAQAGRARVLLLEEDFAYPARIVDERLEPAGDPEAPGVVDDAVDVLIEMVLDQRGEVVVFGSGELADHGPVALVTRY